VFQSSLLVSSAAANRTFQGSLYIKLSIIARFILHFGWNAGVPMSRSIRYDYVLEIGIHKQVFEWVP
jgi:hypothetical protein